MFEHCMIARSIIRITKPYIYYVYSNFHAWVFQTVCTYFLSGFEKGQSLSSSICQLSDMSEHSVHECKLQSVWNSSNTTTCMFQGVYLILPSFVKRHPLSGSIFWLLTSYEVRMHLSSDFLNIGFQIGLFDRSLYQVI